MLEDGGKSRAALRAHVDDAGCIVVFGFAKTAFMPSTLHSLVIFAS